MNPIILFIRNIKYSVSEPAKGHRVVSTMQFAISGEKKMIDIYQWLINSVSKVNLQQQQRLFYNVISWVNDIIEFP